MLAVPKRKGGGTKRKRGRQQRECVIRGRDNFTAAKECDYRAKEGQLLSSLKVHCLFALKTNCGGRLYYMSNRDMK
jgi:hypothetical protein